jgi:neurotransmitter:Na+ symporter, NSS family
MAYVVPTLICLIYLKGYYDMFAGKGTGTLIGWMAFAVLLLAVIFWVCFSVGKKPAAKAETKSK